MPAKTTQQLFNDIDEQGSRIIFYMDMHVDILSSWHVNGSNDWTGLN